MSVQKKQRYFKDVSSDTTEDSDYVPANGEVVNVAVCWGESANTPETAICITWDKTGADVLLYTTHTSGTDNYVDYTVTGDGTKAIKIELINNSNSAVTMGAGWSE